jgi:hypothetical protein
MPTARSAVDAAVISDTIYVIGGVGDPGAGTANEAFDDFPLSPSFTSIVLDSPDPSQANQPLIVSFVVTAPIDIPTGIVTVTNSQNSQQCSHPLVDGMGSCEFSLDMPGVYTITASYGGDSFHSPSSATASHTVVKANTTTSLFADMPDPSLAGQSISVTFEVTSTYGLPAGTVTVTASDSLQSCSDELVAGQGGCEITLDAQGTYTITASYGGDVSFAPSSASTPHTVVDFLDLFIPIILRAP